MPARLLDAFHEALAERSAFEATWREIAALVHPTRAQFLRNGKARPATRLQVYDSTALLAAENLASGLFGALTNPASRWFRLEAEQQDWADAVEAKMNDAFNAGGQAFYTVLPDLFRDQSCI